MIRSASLKKVLVALTMLFLSWGNFQIRGLYFFVIFEALYFFVKLWEGRGRLVFVRSIAVNAVAILLLVTAVSGVLTDLPWSYKGYSLIMVVILALTYFVFAYIVDDVRSGALETADIFRFIRVGFLVQILYLPVQYLLYKAAGFDMNRFLFRDLLHLMPEPTFFRQGAYYPSAFVWHSAVLAPMLVLALLMFDQIWIRAVIVIDAMLCGNNTALIGVILAAMLLGIFWIAKRPKAVRERIFITVVLFATVGAVLIIAGGLWQKIAEKASYLVYRISATDQDSSSVAHASYYLLYPKVLKSNSLFANLFGTGYASSGFSITALNGQYAGLRHWVVESDIMDILISRGIIGFVSYYFFLGAIAVRGFRIDRKYTVAMVVIALQGITYNVQFEYLFFAELIMLASVTFGKNFFEAPERKKTFAGIAVSRVKLIS